jgi:hypothetical protein
MLTFFFSGGFAARSYGPYGRGETRYNYNGKVIDESHFMGSIDSFEQMYIDDPNDGYYIKGIGWFVFCDTVDSIGAGGAIPYIRRVKADSEISLMTSSDDMFRDLTPTLPPLPGKRFPWEDTRFPVNSQYGFEPACFSHTVINAEVDYASNVYVLYTLRTSPFLEEKWPPTSIYQIQKLSPSGELLWQRTLNGEHWSEYFNVVYDLPGLIPVSLNWIDDRDSLIMIGKVPGAKNPDLQTESHYYAIFMNKEGGFLNVQELGYSLPLADTFAPNRANIVANDRNNSLAIFSDTNDGSSDAKEHWLTTIFTQTKPADPARTRYYRITQNFSGGSHVEGTFSGEDINRDGYINLADGEVRSYEIRFSGNSLFPNFSHGLSDLRFFRYILGTTGFRPSYPLYSENGEYSYDADDYTIYSGEFTQSINAVDDAIVTEIFP